MVGFGDLLGPAAGAASKHSGGLLLEQIDRACAVEPTVVGDKPQRQRPPVMDLPEQG